MIQAFKKIQINRLLDFLLDLNRDTDLNQADLNRINAVIYLLWGIKNIKTASAQYPFSSHTHTPRNIEIYVITIKYHYESGIEKE